MIPAREDARNISWLLEQNFDDVDEIILVEGNATDVTLITARACRSAVRVVDQEGVGKGSALRTGFLTACGEIVVMMDADRSMSSPDMAHYLQLPDNGFDIVKSCRIRLHSDLSRSGDRDAPDLRRLPP